jgi:hypothetical protein
VLILNTLLTGVRVYSENGPHTDVLAEVESELRSTERRIFTVGNPRESQAKERGAREEERKRGRERVMSLKIRSDRVTVKGGKKGERKDTEEEKEA